MVDLEVTAWHCGYVSLAHAPPLLPLGASGEALAMTHEVGSTSILLLASRIGTQEVEGMVATTGGKGAWRVAQQVFVEQMRTAMAEMADRQ